MGATKRPRLNKKLSQINESLPDNNVGLNKNKQRKKKVSNMLGSQWSKDELQRFYEAYRKYGKDWKKVASVVRSRSVDMVEAIYNMNRAYLSLPEGTASVVGLVAMMTDHYNILDGSESERESNSEPEIYPKSQKRRHGKSQVKVSKGLDRHGPDLLHNQSVNSSNGCLPFLLKNSPGGSQPRAVGKRTPRFDVSNKSDPGKCVSSNRKSDEHDTVDEVAHGANSLKKDVQREYNPQVSQIAKRRTKPMRAPTIPACDPVAICSTTLSLSLVRNGTDKEEDQKMRKQLHGKKRKFQTSEINHFRGPCNGQEKPDASSFEGKAVATDTQTDLSSQGPKKRSRQLIFEDVGAAPNLHALADLAITSGDTLEASTPDSSKQVNKENLSLDIFQTCRKRDGTSAKHVNDHLSSWPKRKGNHTTETADVGSDLTLGIGLLSEAKQLPLQSISKQKRKDKSIAMNLWNPKADSNMDAVLSEALIAEGCLNEGKKSMNRPKGVTQIRALPKELRSVRPPESSYSSIADQKRAGDPSALPVVQFSSANQVNLPTKLRSRRKVHLPKALIVKEIKSMVNVGKDRRSECSDSLHNWAHDLKEILSHCLTSQALRRWCAFEWLYSAIDYPWFAKREFVEYLNHVGLGHVPRLTRVEWGVIRGSLGKPRRLSQHFLREEKEKLENYRESVRTHYSELRAGSREVLPSDLALPLSVGQRVIAFHPKIGGVHDGSVLTVERNRCRVQFDQPELGVEFVMDIDCMPLDPVENLPCALQRHVTTLNEVHEKAIDWRTRGHMNCALIDNLEDTNGPPNSCSPSSSANTPLNKAKERMFNAISQGRAASGEIDDELVSYNQSCNLSQIQPEVDIRALSCLKHALDKKDMLVSEISDMSSAVQSQIGGYSLKDSEQFKTLYATVRLQLKEVSEQVTSALLDVKKLNTNEESSPPPRPTLLPNSRSNIDHSALVDEESRSKVFEAVKTSRLNARKMVDVATQVMSSLKEGEDALKKIGEALEDCGIPAFQTIATSEPIHQDQSVSCTSVPMMPVNTTVSKHTNASEAFEAQIPSGLISSCVATLLMIQACSERQYPPTEAAQILDSAISSLKPRCTQNIPIYREIEMCMGMVKNQIMALIPT